MLRTRCARSTISRCRPEWTSLDRQTRGFEVDAHIEGEMGEAPHSTAGALLAVDRYGDAGRMRIASSLRPTLK